MWLVIAIPFSGWLVAQGITDRIVKGSDWTAAWVDALAADVFAVILALSMVTNALIVTARYKDRPLAYTRLLRLPLWLGILVVLGVGWVVELAWSNGTEPSSVTPATALLIAAASIVVFIFALKRDVASSARRTSRKQAIAEARSPQQNKRRRAIRIAVAIGVPALCVATGIVLETVPLHFEHCSVNGWDSEYGVLSVYSSCGQFDIASGVISEADIEMIEDYDFVTHGIGLGIPPRLVVVEMTPSK